MPRKYRVGTWSFHLCASDTRQSVAMEMILSLPKYSLPFRSAEQPSRLHVGMELGRVVTLLPAEHTSHIRDFESAGLMLKQT